MTVQQPNSFRTGPDERGHFGLYGGRFVAETLMPLILDLEKAYAEAKNDPRFQKEMDGYLRDYVGRPSPLYFAERLTEHLGGAKIYLKRDVTFLLSGGLDAGNVEEALRITAADGVDVSSGVERAPGVKDVEKIHAFVQAAREAADRLGPARKAVSGA